MKKIWLLLLPFLLLGSTESIEKRIYQQIYRALFPHKRVVRIWSDSTKKLPLLRSEAEPATVVVSSPEDADLLLVFRQTDVGGNRPVVIGRYSLLKVYGDRTVAGFYWKKGRPHLIFFQRGLERYGIKLPEKLQSHLEKNR